jgi:N-succinyldiaminopimelate aminotransferase
MGYAAERVSGFGTTVFTEITALANQTGAVNLGQGFPDFPAPEFIKQAGIAAINADANQYAPGSGNMRLREAIAAKLERQYGLKTDPATEITVTAGATEAIFATMQGLVNPGDEVILFEPYYDSYLPAVQFAGGVPRFCTLRPPEWRVEPETLTALFNDKTKLILINSPHNPTGKVFTPDEMALIAQLCQQHDVIALTDEVYEHITFDGIVHKPLATLPGMRERTVMISSLGKTYSATGWKVGWAVAPAEINQAVFRVHQFVTFCGAAPLQEAAVTALLAPGDYYEEFQAMYQSNRDFLMGALGSAGLTPIMPQGTFFAMTDISHLGFEDDRVFCKWLISEVGVASIPPGSFYHNPADGAGLARFAFCKSRATLEEAARRLEKLKTRLPVQ